MANVVAQPHFVFGVRTGVINNVCFCDEHTVVYPSGNNCVCYNTVQAGQRLIPGRPDVYARDSLSADVSLITQAVL